MIRFFAGLVLVALLIVAGVACTGLYYWDDPAWYFRGNAGYRLRSAQASLRQGDIDRAELIALYLDARGAKDHAYLIRGEVHYRKGKQLADAGQMDDAIPPLTRALAELNKIKDQGTLRLQAAVLIGQSCVYLKQFNEAARALHFVLEEQPDNVEAHRGLAVVYFDQGALLPAVEHLLRVAELDPADGRPHRLLGLIYKDVEQLERAVNAYRQALQRDLHGQSPDTVRKELAECLVRLQRFDEALQTLAELEGEEDDGAMGMHAEALVGQGKTKEASEYLDRILATHGHVVVLLVARAKLHIQANELEKSLELLRRAVAVDRHALDARYQLVLVLRRLGQMEEAEQNQRLLEQTEKDLKELGELHRKAAENPWDGAIRLRLAELCDRLDKPHDAAAWREAAARCPPPPKP